MHPLLACLCNSRIVQPSHAGEAPEWPLLLLWAGLVVLTAAGAGLWFARRRRQRRCAVGDRLRTHRTTTGTSGRPGAGQDDQETPLPDITEAPPRPIEAEMETAQGRR